MPIGTSTVHLEEFTTEAYLAHQRSQAWHRALTHHHLRPLVVQDPLLLFGRLTGAKTTRGLALTRIASSPQTLGRLADPADAWWLALHQDGAAMLRGGADAIALAPGDIVLGPANESAELAFRSDFRQFLISLPRTALQARLPGPVLAGMRHVPGRSGLGRLLAGTLDALSQSFDTMSEDEIGAAELSLAELVASIVTAPGDEASATRGATQAATLRRLWRQIESLLGDPELNLEMLARREGISRRLVQKLFEGTGQTFSSYVRERRLERCRADLANRHYARLSISDICFRWGFNDAAHFSHAFRDRYAISPRDYRQQAAQAAQTDEAPSRRRIPRGWPIGYRDAAAAPAPDHVSGGPAAAPGPQAGQHAPQPALRAAASGGPEVKPGRRHRLPATAQTVHWGYFSRDLAPRLTVDSGDIVTIETLTQHAYDDYARMIEGDPGAQGVFAWTREGKSVDRRGAGPADASIYGRGSGEGFGVHICTGPIAVRGAEPGDVLEVRILDVAPRPSANPAYQGRTFGSNAAAWWGFHYDDLIEEPKPREVITIYEVDCQRHAPCAHAVYSFRWTPQTDPNGVVHRTIDYPGVPVDHASVEEKYGVLEGVRIPVRPHFGVIAVAPAETGLVDSIPPSAFGGNLDNWRIAKGASVYLRVAVDGALLSVGDPHASQGDSELCGTAIECSLTGEFQLILHKAATLGDAPYADIDYPLVETPDEWILHGFSHADYLREFGAQARSAIYERSSLDPAMRDAFRKTRRFLMSAMGLTEDEAISLMSVAVDFGVTQVVDGNWGVHAVIRKALFAERPPRVRRS